MGINRINPYPPSFNKIAARIMDPSRGASTWALGNHKWKKYIGIFTKNANINVILILKVNMIVNDSENDILFFI